MDKDAEKRFVRKTVLISCVIAVFLALVLLGVRAYWPQLNLLRISTLITAGRIDEALALLDDMSSEQLGRDAIDAQRYRAALALEIQGREEEAMALFDLLTSYANAKERALELRYEQAERTLEAGDVKAAAEAFYLLGAYQDAEERYQTCMWMLYPTAEPTAIPTPTPLPTVTPSPAPTEAPTAAPTFTPATNVSLPERKEQVASDMPLLTDTYSPAPTPSYTPIPTPSPSPSPTLAPTPSPAPTTEAEGIAMGQAQTPRGVLALGYAHTVGLLEDGTVIATGRNDAGQCDVSGWTSVAQVAAGAVHTLALREDGTALATGDNQYGQCDVSQWHDLVQVAAGAYDSYGLCKDGTIVHCGWNSAQEIGEWHGVTRIAAGSYGLIALYEGGALGTHASMRLNGRFTDADAARGYAVGLCADGTLVGSNITLPDWRQITCVSAGDGGLLALDVLGCVHAQFFHVPIPELPQLDGRVIAVEAGAAHYALLLSDGRVVCFGNNDSGQCQTESWCLRTGN